jgi:sulfopyruvate decarboxylase TPP-binding subunit
MSSPALSAVHLVEDFEREGVTHVVGLPDNDTAPLFHLLERTPRVRLLRVAREGEAFAMSAGLWMGGATPVVVIQNTGLLESGDALRGTAARMGVPLVMIVGYRGFAKMAARGRAVGPPSRDEVVGLDFDSVALMTEPCLQAWGIPTRQLRAAQDRPLVSAAFQQSRSEQRPVALLLTHTLG